jgi:hypothetical protein
VIVVKQVFRLPVFVSTSEPYVFEIAGSPLIMDGGRLLTRAS